MCYRPGPRRFGAYAREFPRWIDIASQTAQALLLRPKLGASAIRALIETAREAVRINQDTIAAGRVGATAAVARLIGQLSEFDRAILSAQVWALEPVPQHAIADRLGVHPVSVSRNLPRARARFAELLTDPAQHTDANDKFLVVKSGVEGAWRNLTYQRRPPASGGTTRGADQTGRRCKLHGYGARWSFSAQEVRTYRPLRQKAD